MGYLSPTLAVRDMKETITFYRDHLGFKMGMAFPDAGNPEYGDMSQDGAILMFISTKNAGIGNKEKLGIGVNFYIQIDGDIDEYYKELRQKGIKITSNIKDEAWGARDFTIEDINGYKLTFSQASGNIKTCESCGMPMNKIEDFGGRDPSSRYCAHCAGPDGKLKTRQEVYEGMVNFMVNTQNMERKAAEQAARKHMAKMPAWGGKPRARR